VLLVLKWSKNRPVLRRFILHYAQNNSFLECPNNEITTFPGSLNLDMIANGRNVTAKEGNNLTQDAASARSPDIPRRNSSPFDQERNSRKILGINFFAGRAREAVALGMKGGLVVAPAAPALVNLPHDEHYRQAVSCADFAITDSSLMVMLWNLTRRDNIRRVSGLEYLSLLLRRLAHPNQETLFFIMPSRDAAVRALKWLNGQGIKCGESQCYIAPMYQSANVEDIELLALLKQLRPTQIIIGLGGGTQEKLGLFLRNRLSYTPGIHCIGAAIGFLTGDQVKIPLWADSLYLGWLFRCLHNPKSYIPRYWSARKLFWQMIFENSASPEPPTAAKTIGI
jgi:N-acetylglucosaminyldiphosphoundecaprenol N-acetyl-beta-D-mannosaminyltransferase